jgi:hypothetical protein
MLEGTRTAGNRHYSDSLFLRPSNSHDLARVGRLVAGCRLAGPVCDLA